MVTSYSGYSLYILEFGPAFATLANYFHQVLRTFICIVDPIHAHTDTGALQPTEPHAEPPPSQAELYKSYRNLL